MAPTGAASVTATFDKVQIRNNRFGIKGDTSNGPGTTGSIAFTVHDSMISGNSGAAVSAVNLAVTGPVVATVSNSALANNSVGVNANGPNTLVRVGGSTLSGNSSMAFQVQAGGLARSSGNNTVVGAVGTISGVDPLM